ncbi:Leucine-rich repeat-containing protein 72 [Holothuria leucospilota]|uniref:Leucine-rich repeat-containing protein 72 n=1 Tax=Holothuria leucospilota TaxID=206669 RepID=A0A9Q1CPT3_HOLLE|nr:Leucine-rich repeat-containing protein 72 [Holothuria leucospilota]
MAGDVSRDRDRSSELIRDQMTAQGIRKNLDVTQISLSNRDLSDITDLSCFKRLNYLWLNGNKLRMISVLSENYRLSELYLQDNELVDISGALNHLTNLRILMLQNNQLTRLEETVGEFKFMQGLETLNLSKNPLAQESEYRYYTVFHVPSLKLLDRREIKKSERDQAAKLYCQERQALLDTISFGRRWEAGPPQKAEDTPIQVQPPFKDFDTIHSSHDDGQHSELPGRADRRSLMQYSHFDWSKVPREEERRLQKYETKSGNAQIVTVRFR